MQWAYSDSDFQKKPFFHLNVGTNQKLIFLLACITFLKLVELTFLPVPFWNRGWLMPVVVRRMCHTFLSIITRLTDRLTAGGRAWTKLGSDEPRRLALQRRVDEKRAVILRWLFKTLLRKKQKKLTTCDLKRAAVLLSNPPSAPAWETKCHSLHRHAVLSLFLYPDQRN